MKHVLLLEQYKAAFLLSFSSLSFMTFLGSPYITPTIHLPTAKGFRHIGSNALTRNTPISMAVLCPSRGITLNHFVGLSSETFHQPETNTLNHHLQTVGHQQCQHQQSPCTSNGSTGGLPILTFLVICD